MAELFEKFGAFFLSSPETALLAAFFWGILSVLLSPCHLASVPLIVGYINSAQQMSTRRAALISAFFSAGILITIALIALATSALGRIMGDIGPWSYYLFSAVLIVAGLMMLGVVTLPSMGTNIISRFGHSLPAALSIGLFFGIALGPCTFGFMAPLIAVSLSLASEDFFYAVLLLLVYGLGHCGVIAAAGTAGHFVQRYLDFNSRFAAAVLLRRICGAGIILAGGYVLYIAP